MVDDISDVKREDTEETFPTFQAVFLEEFAQKDIPKDEENINILSDENNFNRIIIKEEVDIQNESDTRNEPQPFIEHCDTNENIPTDQPSVSKPIKDFPHVNKPGENQNLQNISCSICRKPFTNIHTLESHFQSEHPESTLFSCPDCGKGFTRKCSLIRHRLIHTETIQYKCPSCDKSYKDKHTLIKHQRFVHERLRPFACPDCGKRFMNRSLLKLHQLTHTTEKPFKCSECDKSFAYKRALGRHQLHHSGLRPFTCDKCETSFLTRGELKTHQAVHNTRRPFSCTICLKSYKRKGHLTEHLQSHSPSKHFSCSQCDVSFVRKHNLVTHIKRIHPVGNAKDENETLDQGIEKSDENFQRETEETDVVKEINIEIKPEPFLHCNVDNLKCEAPFEDSEMDTLPITVDYGSNTHHQHQAEKQLEFQDNSCPQIEDQNPKQPQSQTHEETLSHQQNDKDFQPDENQHPIEETCSVCQKTFPSEHLLDEHYLNEHPEAKPFSCPTCGRKFYDRIALTQHQLVHLDTTRYQCPSCEKSYKAKYDLKKHQRHAHEQLRPYKCPECGKCFARRHALKSHEMLHLDKRPFKCLECGKSFITEKCLETHQVYHSGIRRFLCDECGKAFHTRQDMTNHQKVHLTVKPFGCSVCNKSFKRKSHLTEHQLSHAEPTFRCVQCQHAFKRKVSLVQHMRRVHFIGEKSSDPSNDKTLQSPSFSQVVQGDA